MMTDCSRRQAFGKCCHVTTCELPGAFLFRKKKENLLRVRDNRSREPRSCTVLLTQSTQLHTVTVWPRLMMYPPLSAGLSSLVSRPHLYAAGNSKPKVISCRSLFIICFKTLVVAFRCVIVRVQYFERLWVGYR